MTGGMDCSREAASEWQPIATAPDDGSCVLLWCRVVGLLQGRMDRDGRWCHAWDGEDIPRPENLTHWRPEPKSPTRMTDAVDISASAVERLRLRLVLLDSRAGRRDAADMVVALRAALDRAERERDEALQENERMREALEKLARLGNGQHYGNSIGNEIARAALEPRA